MTMIIIIFIMISLGWFIKHLKKVIIFIYLFFIRLDIAFKKSLVLNTLLSSFIVFMINSNEMKLIKNKNFQYIYIFFIILKSILKINN